MLLCIDAVDSIGACYNIASFSVNLATTGTGFFAVFIVLLVVVFQCRRDIHRRAAASTGTVGGGSTGQDAAASSTSDEEDGPVTVYSALTHGMAFVRELHAELSDVTRQIVFGENSAHATGRRNWRFARVNYHPAGVEDELAPGVPVPDPVMERGFESDDESRLERQLDAAAAEDALNRRYDADMRGDIEMQRVVADKRSETSVDL